MRIKIDLDVHELFYYIEGLAKYKGDAKGTWCWVIDLLPCLSNKMRECIREWCKRDLGYLYGYGDFNAECPLSDKEAFESFLRVYDIPVANNDTDEDIIISPDMEELKCYIRSKAHGSHLRQDIWEWLVNNYNHFTKREKKEIFDFIFWEFSEEQLGLVGAVDDYKRCLARYSPTNQYKVTFSYKLNGSYGSMSKKAYKYEGEFYIDFRRLVKDWKNEDGYLTITNATLTK